MKTQEKKQKQVQPTSKKIEESLSYAVEVTDKEGRVLQQISAPSRSYVQQWNQLVNIQALTASAPGETVKDIYGADYDLTRNPAALGADGGIGVVTKGIRVGKGTTAVAITDYALESPCEEGTGTDEFEHQAVAFTEPSVDGSTCSFQIVRTMINNSGVTITGIKEIGCYIMNSSHRFLGFRDVLPSAVSVPTGGSITITYTIKVTV